MLPPVAIGPRSRGPLLEFLLWSLLAASLTLTGRCPEASASPAQEQQGPPGVKSGKRRASRDSRTYLYDVRLQDPEALAKGAMMRERVLAAAGGLVLLPPEGDQAGAPRSFGLFDLLPGLRYQQLEATYSNVDAATNQLQIHHLVPRTVHFGPGGNGYLYSELVRFEEKMNKPVPQYRREVLAGDVSWFEVDGQYSRQEAGSLRAKQNVGRELCFGLGLHGLATLGADLAWLEDQEVDGLKLGLYLARLPFSVRGKTIDEVEDVILVVDEAQARLVDIQYFDVNQVMRRKIQAVPEGEVRLDLDPATMDGIRVNFIQRRLSELGGDSADNRAIAEAEAARLVLPTTLRFPAAWSLQEAKSPELVRLEVAEALFEPIDPRALMRPWQSGQTFTEAPRADAWDPPAPSEQPSAPPR
jgi:hypothetical protein